MISRISAILGKGAPKAPGYTRSVSRVRSYKTLSAISAKAAGWVTPDSRMDRIDISDSMDPFIKELSKIISKGQIPTNLDLVPMGRGLKNSDGSFGSMTLDIRNELFEVLFEQEVLKERSKAVFYQNSGESIAQFGHFHVFGSGIDLGARNLNDDALRACEVLSYPNLLRKTVGTMGIGSQELTPSQAAMKQSISRPFHRVENGYDIGAGLDPVASREYAISQWKANASVDQVNFFLGKGSMVEACLPESWASKYTTSDGFHVYALPLQTSGLAHPLEGSALHIVGVHPNGFLTTYVIGAGKHPWLLVDQMNQPVAGSMWSVRHDILELTLNNDVSLRETMGASGFEDAQVFMREYWDWVRTLDKGEWMRCMKLSAFDQLSPYMAGYSKSEQSLLSYIADRTVTEEDLLEWDSSMEERGGPPELFDDPNDQIEADKAFDVSDKSERLMAGFHYMHSLPLQTTDLTAGNRMMSHLNSVKGAVGQGLALDQSADNVTFIQNLSNPADLKHLKGRLKAGGGVVLCYPTEQTLKCFSEALNVPVQDDPESIEMYGVHCNACVISYKPVSSPLPIQGTGNLPPNEQLLGMAEPHVQLSEGEQAQQRISMVVDGLRKAQRHDVNAVHKRITGTELKAGESGGGPSDIWGMANMNLGGNYRHYNFHLDGENKTVQCSFITNLWGAAMNVWANPDGTKAQQKGSDWYLMMATCVFGPSNAWHPSSDGLTKGWYAYEYILGLAPQDYPNQVPGPDTLQLMSSSPDSSPPSPETRGVSTSQSTNVNGSIGFFGPTLTGTIGVGHSWSMSDSSSFSVSFCDLQNSSTNGGSGANGYWSYTFNDFTADGSPSNFEINTFQPSGALVWKMPDEYRKKNTNYFQVQLQFGATFRNWYYNDGWNSQDWKVGISGSNPSEGMATVKIKFPLDEAQQKAKEAAQEGWVKTSRVCDVWQSDGLSPITQTGTTIPAGTEIREIIRAISQVGENKTDKEFWKVKCKDQSVYKGDFYIPVEQAPVQKPSKKS
ncbi:hypothetical protein [Nitrospina gracilis]|uniref:hypothetical protein n=1 Tax=Nitrospina gracilis TaxID=35801 RepID=UPI001F1B76C9|nr:hypothetical protein [Nitrospina gracilis]MCF8721409.1 hypothetical protein [Nitrospina gracilis Nb-211]